MTHLPSNIDREYDSSRPDTPLASQLLPSSTQHSTPHPPALAPDAPLPLISTSTMHSPPSKDSHSLLPIPSTNHSQPSFSRLEALYDATDLDPLPPEIASADISFAPDGTFVETSSGLAARELKRRYDQRLGVGLSIRSPYAITAFVNQHGKQMYRIGHRELSAPAASAAQVDDLVSLSKSPSTKSDSQPSRSKRRSRLSMHVLLPPSMFKNINGNVVPRPLTSGGPSRKLRKTRSIPDMFEFAAGAGSASTPADSPWQQYPPGRAHAHSVTGAMSTFPIPSSEALRTPVRSGDIFSDVMNSLSSTQSLVFSSEDGMSPTIIVHPFGAGVTFDSPARPATDFLPAPPHMLREMQSFESGLTARQADPIVSSPQKETSSELPKKPPSPSPSFCSIKRAPSPPLFQEAQEFLPLPETSMHSRYSTDVFDVLQTYRGLPRLDKLSAWSAETTVIKMSLSADDSAAPRDDPRFVIWGEFVPERDQDDLSISQGSFTDLSSSAHSSIASVKKRSITKSGLPPELSRVSLSSGQGTQKVVVAATIERWIAQLTSELNYDELLNFFLTYRTYITAVDLCHLLICRFHWALGRHSSSQDERVRRIVRVRTFVAIRYWLLTFFVVDFVPNRELRLLVADWLNTLTRDPILEKHNDGLSIVRKLKKVVKDCKVAHTPSSAKTTTKRRVSKKPPKATHVLGEKFAEAIASQDEDSDVDLDFLPDEVPPASSTTPGGYSGNLPNAHLHVGAALSPTTALPLAALSVLQQSPPMTDPSAPSLLPIHHNNAISRAFVNTIGRLGRWKRVVLNARAAAVRPALAPCAGVSAFDLDLGGSVARGNLLTLNSGVEQYLKMIEQQSPAVPLHDDSMDVERPSLSLSVASSFSEVEPAIVVIKPPPAECADVVVTEREEQQPKLPVDAAEPDVVQVLVAEPPPPSSDAESDPVKPVPTAEPVLHEEVEAESSEMASIRSSSTDSLGKPLSPRSRAISIIAPAEPSPWQFDVVSIDDLDLSDTSSGYDFSGAPAVPPGLRKVPRRLPLRRDFEFVPRSESGASTDIHSHDSLASGATSSVISSSSAGGGGGLGGTIQPWQMTALVDSLSDDEEGGDVEAALRRLEGQINPKKKREKASKVDGWVRTIRERLAAGDYNNDQSRFPDDYDDDDDDDDYGGEPVMDDVDEDDSIGFEGLSKGGENMIPSPDSQTISSVDVVDQDRSVLDSAKTPLATQSSHRIFNPTSPTSLHELNIPNNNIKTEDVPPKVEFSPKKNIADFSQKRISARLSTSQPPPKKLSLSLKFGNSDVPPRTHRSFILAYRAETLVEHFSMIDRDLFMGIKFEELVLHDWTSCEEVDVLDWTQFLKDRARWKSESLWPQKTTALAAIRARFNLIANFTLSEVVLTQPTERALVVGKFIRIAWKAYSSRNFHTLVAIIAGLQSEWVSKAMHRSWSRIGIWETRMFKDLKEFTASTDDFKYIRRAVEAIADADAKSMDIWSRAGSVISSGAADGPSSMGRTNPEVKPPAQSCIPFIGAYLSELHRLGQLPDLIDPTAPNEAVRIDPATSNFDAPAHPEVFSPLALLPPSMQLEPLINVHKQRLIAGVIKSLVAGQHHASRVQFSVDKKTFQKCLKIRALDSDTLHRALARYPD